MSEKGWLLAGISGIDISSRIKTVMDGWMDGMLRRHPVLIDVL